MSPRRRCGTPASRTNDGFGAAELPAAPAARETDRLVRRHIGDARVAAARSDADTTRSSRAHRRRSVRRSRCDARADATRPTASDHGAGRAFGPPERRSASSALERDPLQRAARADRRRAGEPPRPPASAAAPALDAGAPAPQHARRGGPRRLRLRRRRALRSAAARSDQRSSRALDAEARLARPTRRLDPLTRGRSGRQDFDGDGRDELCRAARRRRLADPLGAAALDRGAVEPRCAQRPLDAQRLGEQRVERRGATIWLGPSQGARSGSGCTSTKSASMPTATAARASGATLRRSPSDAPSPAPGCWTACVASKQTGAKRAHRARGRASRRRDRCSRTRSRARSRSTPARRRRDLLDREAHVERRDELALLEVERTRRSRRRPRQIGLPAQERRDLQAVDDLRDRLRLRRLVHVGGDRQRRSRPSRAPGRAGPRRGRARGTSGGSSGSPCRTTP